MILKKFIPIAATVSASIIFLFVFIRTTTCSHPISIISPAFEIEPKFVLASNGDVVFSAVDQGTYSIYKYTSSGLKKEDHRDGYLSPFLIDNKVYGLIDKNGDQNYTTDHGIIKKLIGGRFITYLHVFPGTDEVVVQLNNDNTVYLLDLSNETKTAIFYGVQKVHNILKLNTNSFIINYDGYLSHYDLKTKSERLIAKNVNGDSMNAFITDDLFLYYANQGNENHYKIFEVNLKVNPLESRVMHKKEGYDVRMPKRRGDLLYFLELVNSEYLLSEMNLRDKTVKRITSKGVIYMYEFGAKNNIILSYSDFENPKCIADYNRDNEKFSIKTGSRRQLSFTHRAIKNKDGSNAYLIKAKDKSYKGVILYFHPGLHSDFSPRWDPVIVNLIMNGYIILAPNYPMSSGYGQTFYQSDLQAAVNDINHWKEYVKANLSGYPLYYLSSSSGNILMEKSLKENGKDVTAFSSLFGIASDELKFTDKRGLYVLGQNDPIIDIESRKHTILAQNNDNKIISYENEGHWIRHQENNSDLIRNILTFYCDEKPLFSSHDE
ncbi:alpha/beta hydrolase family protein [Daejeonella lutea]|uniref:Dipeptidyl aminopeptidase/acylaminoacyl peptidase n=1 Tax=Daejeonella lutea TaxID=572036 RepID=A0A1T5B1Z6_9SPHI|nr:hypothetical protein [Daejeonella lutea]SKB41234.1 Dipeptidyl aminopeptidase/acylaminoacyl peptidase [Daejeonella lutea]